MSDKQYTVQEMREAFVAGVKSAFLSLGLKWSGGFPEDEALRRYPDIFVGPQIEHIIDQSGNVCHAIRNYPDKEDKREPQ